MEDHTLDDDGEHDEDSCYRCHLDRDPVKSDCHCGKCCHLIIEVELQDAEREPKIKEKGKPLFTSPEFTRSGERELAGYLLNTKENGYACAFLDRETNLCSIYPTRPLICRLFDCDGEGGDQLIELVWLPPR